MALARRVRLIAALAAASLGIPTAAAIADPGDRLEEARAAEATTVSTIADLERQLAQLAAAREEAAIQAGLANEAYLEATVHLEAARAESRSTRRAADAASAEVEVARSALGTIAQLLYQNGGASLAAITPFLTTDNFSRAMRSATHMEQLARRTDSQLEHFEALRTVAAILTERAERAHAAEQAAVASLAAAAEVAQERADAATFQLTFSTEQRDALIVQLARQRDTTVELERARQDALEEQRIERENRAALRDARAVAAIDSFAADPAPALALAPAPALVDERDTAVSRDGDRTVEEATTSSTADTTASAPAPTTSSPAPTPSPTRTTPAPAPTTSSPTPTPSPTRTTPLPTPTTPAPAPTTPLPTPTTPAPAPTTSSPTPTPTPTPTTPPPPVAPAPLPAAQVALNFALAQVGKPYVWGAAGPDGYDCSGLTMASYNAAGIYIGRTTRVQYDNTVRVPLADMRPGDLVFYSSNGLPSGIYHVAMYTGNGMRVHAPSPGKLVEHVKMYYYNVMPYAGRVTR